MDTSIGLILLVALVIVGLVAAGVLDSLLKLRRAVNKHLADDLADLRKEVAYLRLEVDQLREMVGPVSDRSVDNIKVKPN